MVSHRALMACVVVVGSIAPLACVSSSAPTTHCRAGQHDAGSGSCVVDDALIVRNRAGTDYWRCVQNVRNVTFTYKLAFVDQGAVTSGSGSVRYMNDGPPDDYPSDSTEAVTDTFSWYEGRPTTLAWSTSVDVSANRWFTTLMDIVPTLDTAGTASRFTARFVRFGLVQSPMTCTLTLGSF
jgi:hypothetical protein